MPTPLTWSLLKTTPLSNNNKIDSLLWGVNWLSGNLTYSYPTTGSLWSTSSTTGYGPTTGNREPWSNLFGETSQSDRKFISQMLQKWTNVANLTFTEVSDTSTTVGDIRFAYSYSENQKDAQAWAYSPGSASSSGDMWFNALGSSAKKEFKPGTYEGFAVLHELGHALGLKHPFSASAGIDSILPDSWDSQSFTVMSYSPSTDKEAKSATYFPTTLMLFDIQAIQYLYGTNYNHNAGNNIYLYSDVTDYRETIWDGGGIDSVNYGGIRDAIIDLREGYGSQIGNPIYSLSGTGSKISTLNNIWIAYGVTIENSSGGSGDDKITGNNVDNSLNGGNGNDVMYGGLGNDTFDWDSSKRSGNDAMYGGMGDDVFVLDSIGDSVIEYANEGNDSIWVDFSYSLTSIVNIENLFGYGINSLNLIGDNAANSFMGGKQNDSINGDAGIDTAVYASIRSNYTLTKGASTYTVTDKTGSDGTDTLLNIERVKFTDGFLALDIAPGQNAGEVYRLYQAGFARTPDMSGVKYHLNDMESNGLPLWQIASNFLASPEFASKYGSNPSDTQYINALYKNVLNRIPGESEVAWYQNQFTTKAMDRQAALIGFSESPENVALVGSAIANGIWLG
jgi:hypothetical protein